MNVGGFLILAVAIVVFNYVARPIEAFTLLVKDWRRADEEERIGVIVCMIVVSLFFLIIFSAPSVYQVFFRNGLWP